ncbi:MAG TPA: phosphoglucosamine mutase [Thermoplasmata archaeon]|nr:phosphoglucosamine mutase [Thermoplasmata archaeon]
MSDSPVPRLFGTDGIRRVVNAEFSPVFIAEVAAATAEYLDGEGPVLIAQDYRTTTPGIARILAGVLSMDGIEVVELGPMPTPCLQYNVRVLKARLGLMVTASHNPTDFNGIKFSGPGGLEITPEEEHVIERNVHLRRHAVPSWDRAAPIRTDTNGVTRYLESVVAQVDRERIAKRQLRVVLDCGNGTSAATSPLLLRSLGCRLTTLNANPDGHFPGHPSEPTEANLADLRKTVVAVGADLGIAHDGDSDRIAFVDETGRYIPGEEALGLFAREMLRRAGGGTIVTSVTSTRCVEEAVRVAGGKLVITRSGSLPVARGILEENAVFGGEENGGFYWPKHQDARDGPASSAMMLDLIAETGRSLANLLSDLPKFHVVKRNVPLPAPVKTAVLERVRATLGADAERLLTIDGVKAFYPDGWILVRPSGTEPVCRVYAESRDAGRAKEMCERAVTLVATLVHELAATAGPR